ncbi:hypothetical protein [Absidia glauca]|uniref:Uncharacterized protein n=1 Tax=Absidia glauca TaxID=4829 RepID=A0A163J945_ABSGL|nr:hypothetical protein [Absidia glauca]
MGNPKLSPNSCGGCGQTYKTRQGLENHVVSCPANLLARAKVRQSIVQQRSTGDNDLVDYGSPMDWDFSVDDDIIAMENNEDDDGLLLDGVSTANDGTDAFDVNSLDAFTETQDAADPMAPEIPNQNNKSLSPPMTMAIGLYEVLKKTKISRSQIDEVLNMSTSTSSKLLVRKYDLDAPTLPSQYLIKQAVDKRAKLEFSRYDACENGCALYTDDTNTNDNPSEALCEHCKAPRYRSHSLAPVSYVDILSIRSVISAKLLNDKTRQQLMYRHERVNTSGNLLDIFDGAAYKDLVDCGEFQSRYDVAIGLSIDGFSPLNRGGFQATMVNMVIFNIDPMQRYKLENMIQLMIIPGQHKPKALDSFLQPIFDELLQLAKAGMEVKLNDGETIKAKVYLLMFGGDIPAVADLINHSGHMSYHGCRICEVLGVRGNNGGMYFHGKSTNQTIRSAQSFRDQTKNLGLQRSMISYYPGFKGPSFFGLDEMHLFGQNLAKRIRDYFVPATSTLINVFCFNLPWLFQLYKRISLSVRPHTDRNQNKYPFQLQGVTLSQVGLSMVSSRPDIPLAHFDGNWGNPVERANARAVDWLAQ